MNAIDFLIFGVSLFLGGLGALVVATRGERWSLLDKPNERSSHDQLIPKGGGIGILAAFFVCSAVCSVPAGFWIPAGLLALVSFRGDRFEINVFVRLAAQFFLAFCFLIFVVPADPYHSGLVVKLGLFVFFLFFVVGTANYYNFMDGINGIAGIAGLVAFGLLGTYGIAAGKNPALIMLCFSMVCACIGFLPFNLPRARVFMGDVGSILLGFVFSGIVILWTASVSEFLLLTSFLFLFYADELVTLRERLRDGERLTRAHRRHLYQVLVNEYGLAHWKVSAGYGFAQLGIGLVVWGGQEAGLLWRTGWPAIFFGIFVVVNNRVKTRAGLGGS